VVLILMKIKLKQWWSKILPISTKQTVSGQRGARPKWTHRGGHVYICMYVTTVFVFYAIIIMHAGLKRSWELILFILFYWTENCCTEQYTFRLSKTNPIKTRGDNSDVASHSVYSWQNSSLRVNRTMCDFISN
jgi:hypothetical protein